jgi:hypothetical protein
VKILLTTTVVIELGAGLALLCCPSAMVTIVVGVLLETPADLTVARVGGAGLFALGLACWLARGDPQSRTARGLVAAMLVYDVAAVAVLTFAGIGFGLRGVALWAAVILHAVITIWCVACLLHSPRSAKPFAPGTMLRLPAEEVGLAASCRLALDEDRPKSERKAQSND